MGECPFCGGEVSEQVVMYGGTCPHCFANIPGEEEATDPGEAVKQEQAVADRRRAQRRVFLPLLLAIPVAGAILAGSIWYALQPAPELAMLDFDDSDAYTFDFQILADAEPEAQEEPSEDPAPTKQRPSTGSSGSSPTKQAGIVKPSLSSSTDDFADDALEGLADAGKSSGGSLPSRRSGSADDDGDLGNMAMNTLGSVGDLGSPSAGPGPIRVSMDLPPLSNEAEIRQMVTSTLKRYLPRLSACYSSARNARPDLEGNWVLIATVQTDGSVAGVSLTGVDVADDVLESCVVRQVERWRFQRITRSLPIRKTLPFRRS